MSVPNQKIIYIQRSSDKDKKDYLKISNQNLNKAVRDLSSKAVMLWLYLVDNANGYRKEMYPIDFINWCKLSDSTYRRAWSELEEKAYIIESQKHKNTYMFTEVSETYDERNQNEIIKTVDKDIFNELKEELF